MLCYLILPVLLCCLTPFSFHPDHCKGMQSFISQPPPQTLTSPASTGEKSGRYPAFTQQQCHTSPASQPKKSIATKVTNKPFVCVQATKAESKTHSALQRLIFFFLQTSLDHLYLSSFSQLRQSSPSGGFYVIWFLPVQNKWQVCFHRSFPTSRYLEQEFKTFYFLTQSRADSRSVEIQVVIMLVLFFG